MLNSSLLDGWFFPWYIFPQHYPLKLMMILTKKKHFDINQIWILSSQIKVPYYPLDHHQKRKKASLGQSWTRPYMDKISTSWTNILVSMRHSLEPSHQVAFKLETLNLNNAERKLHGLNLNHCVQRSKPNASSVCDLGL